MSGVPPLSHSSLWKPKTGRQLAIWGLSASVQLTEQQGVYCIHASQRLDALLAEGYLAASLAMASMDLERRLWSGRLAEVLGEKLWKPGVTAADLDPFVRLLGFRRGAKAAFRKLTREQQREAEAYALGVNAWIDQGAWRGQKVWDLLRSRPRLWSATDCLLLAFARGHVDPEGVPVLSVTDDAKAAGWTQSWDERIRMLWAALSDDALRAPGAVGAGYTFTLQQGESRSSKPRELWAGSPSTLAPKEPADAPWPCIVPETVVKGGDNHRVLEPQGAMRRLKVQRPDIQVRGGLTQRPWLRWSNRGGLISDLLQTGMSDEAPTGTAFAWCWERQPAGANFSESGKSPVPRQTLPDRHPWHLVRTSGRANPRLPLTLVPQVDPG
ncbi:MAG TPA: hypothetical protein DIU15_15265 [Deltaproteobacteria bacterium]|nr:hypothetical protein [Deltaproteobacteria bacterium]HCP47400.1 hypothetical protein [Deltaproteobacteria bacterium]